jgi:hypothetical protein
MVSALRATAGRPTLNARIASQHRLPDVIHRYVRLLRARYRHEITEHDLVGCVPPLNRSLLETFHTTLTARGLSCQPLLGWCGDGVWEIRFRISDGRGDSFDVMV